MSHYLPTRTVRWTDPSQKPHAPHSRATASAPSLSTSPARLLALQRGAGNAAVVDLLASGRSDRAVQVQRDVINANPVLIKSGDTQAQTERRQSVSDAAIAALPIWASNYANLWLTAATTALAGAPEPEDAKARQNWWLALAGNLTWAATTMIAPEATAAIRIMSFAGAAVGSGVLASKDEAPSAKSLVGLQLGKARDAIVQLGGLPTREVAVECGFAMVEDLELQKQRLWHRLLPNAPYENSEAIIGNMQARIASGLQQFSDQWKAWESGDEGATPAKLGEALKKRSWFEKMASERADTLILMEQLRLQWKADHPFKPNLSF